MQNDMQWLNLKEKTVVITGGSGGIGQACLTQFHAAGANVVSLDPDSHAAAPLLAQLDPDGTNAVGYDCDITDAAQLRDVAQAVLDRFGRVDVLVNNAGILCPGPLDSVALDDWQRMFRVNLDGALLASQQFGRAMLAVGSGAIVHVASISASQPQPFSGAYSATKASVAMLSRQLAYEWGPRGVRSNVVSPGLVLTPMSEAFYADPEIRRAREALVPMGRIARPQDMADVALFLASDRASYVNGQEIVVDGGLSQTLMGLVPRPGFSRAAE